jgi:hypothetical protein
MRPPLSDDDERLLRDLEARKPSELVPIFLELSRRQSARRRCADLTTQLDRDPFVFTSAVDQRTSLRYDAVALEAAREFEAVLLSPLAPLGTCAVVSPTTQDRSVTTTRSSEVVSDPTNMLAIVGARRLRERGTVNVRLCTLHQVVRPQRFPGGKNFSQHFRMFAMAEAGIATAEHGFEIDAMMRQISALFRLFDLAEESLGASIRGRRATLHVAERQQALADRLTKALSRELPTLPVDVAPGFASGYYDGIRFLIDVADPTSDGLVQLADVGLFDWMGKLTSNKRTRFVASGLGIQRLPMLFGGKKE